MEKFANLPDDKKNVIVNAGLTAFSKSGYKKCSVSDIASLAGIAKSMIFHYFGTKKNMYFYLLEFIRNEIVDAILQKKINDESDFFERIRLATEVKVAVLKKYPCAISFIMSLYFETDKEVVDDIKVHLEQRFDFSTSFALKDIDSKKFKPGIDPNLVLTMLHRYSEGFLGKAPYQPDLNVDEITAEFCQCLNMLRDNLYKEEYL
jgi:AcrR family transcriptional regulator